MRLLHTQPTADTGPPLGPRLKAARSKAGMTLKALSAASGLSQSFLSRLERDQVSASIANLLQVCRCLNLSVATLLEEVAGEEPTRSSIFRGGGVPIAADGYHFRPVAPALRGRRMDAFLLDFPRGGGMDLVVAHEGEELLVVIDGRIRFRFGDQVAELEPGDAVQFDSSLPHTAANIGIRSARCLMVTVPARSTPFGWQRIGSEVGKPEADIRPKKSRTQPARRKRL